MITATGVELRIGARTLLQPTSFRVGPGDRIGLVGRNGAGKTTLTRVLAGEGQATDGSVSRSGVIGYLPQDPRPSDPTTSAKDHILSIRDLHNLAALMAKIEEQMASSDPKVMAKALDRYPKVEARFLAAGGYAAQSEALRIAANLGLDNTLLNHGLGSCPVVNADGWNLPAFCSLVVKRCCLMSPPTTLTLTRLSGCATICAPTRAVSS